MIVFLLWLALSEGSAGARVEGLQQDLVERALAEPNDERRRAIVSELRALDFAAVEKAVRTRAYKEPAIPKGRIVERTSKTDHDGEPFAYAVHVPEGYDPAKAWPVLITLHGTNRAAAPDAGTKWLETWRGCAAARERAILVAPSTTRHTWSSRPGHSRILTALREVTAELHADPDRVWVDGFSMGARGAFNLAEFLPDRWAALAPRCSMPDVRHKKDKTMVPMLCENFRNVPVYWTLGAKDEIVPVEWARAARDAIVGMKYDLVYREHAEGGHQWSLEKDEEVFAWLEKQRRPAYPEEVVWKSFEKGFARAYWVEVLKRTEAAPPIVTVRLDMFDKESERRSEYRPPTVVRARRSGNAIDVTCEEVKELRVYLDDAMMDLGAPVRVTVNGAAKFEGKVKRSLDVLIGEARKRSERSMTFSAYVDLKVP